MKYILVIGDGMADNAVPELGGKTPLQAAEKPAIDVEKAIEDSQNSVMLQIKEVLGQALADIDAKIAKLEANAVKLAYKDFYPATEISEVINILRPLATKKKIIHDIKNC